MIRSKYICLDRIMFSVPIESVSNIKNESFLGKVTPTGNYLSKTFSQIKPYSLFIKVNYEKDEVVINVSSKILKERYHEMININTFDILIDKINETNLIKLKTEDVLRSSKTISCDITEDREEVLTKQKICALNNTMNRQVWQTIPYETGILFKKKNISLTMYNKAEEIRLKPNRYHNSLFDPKQLLSNFRGKVRYELKIKSPTVVRNIFGIDKTTETNVYKILQSSKTPIEDIYNYLFPHNDTLAADVLQNKLTRSLKKKNRAINYYKSELLCMSCDYDIKKVKMVLTTLTSSKSNISSMLKPYKEIIYAHTLESSIES